MHQGMLEMETTRADPDLYLHIGLPKTATTYLQREVFPRLTRLRYLGTPRGHFFDDVTDDEHGRRTLTSCFKRSAVLWAECGDQVASAFLDGATRSGILDRDVLVSDEGIGRSASRPFLFREHLEGLERFAHGWGFGRLRVLCLFRRQDTWLASHYAHMSNRNPSASQRDFEEWVEATLDPARKRYSFGVLMDYGALWEQLNGALGRDDVLMLPYEYLSEDPRDFARTVLRFMTDGGEVSSAAVDRISRIRERRNVRSAAPGRWRLRPLDGRSTLRLRPRRFFERLGMPPEIPLAPRDWGRSRTIELRDDTSASVLEAYEGVNRLVAGELDIDLNRYGYYPMSLTDANR